MLPSPRRFAVGVTLTAGIIYLMLGGFAKTPRARLNVMQFVATLFFLIVILWRKGAKATEPLEPESARGSLRDLALAMTVGACVWARMLPFYFVSEDFEHLSTARQPIFSTLKQLLVRGQLGAFLRPVGFASIFLDYRIWQQSPTGYHLTNLAIHLATIAGLYYLCVYLEAGTRIAACAALIYAVMPIHAEAVAWMGARFDLLSGCFTVWSIAFYLKFRKDGSRSAYAASLMCFLLAAFSKENAYVLPLLLILIESLLMAKRRLGPVLGLSAFGLVLFGYRWLALGGIGGYVDPSGRPITFNVGLKTLEGLLIRAPAQMLLGYNWFQLPIDGIRIVASVTGALLLLAALYSRLGEIERKRLLFCFGWMILAILPAHPLLLIDASLMNSRILHLGSVGLALLVAQVFCGLPGFRVAWIATAFLSGLLSLGSLHNLEAWSWTSQLSRNVLLELHELDPLPETGTHYVFHGLPDTVRGVYFFRAGLTDPVRIAYGRDDLTAERSQDSAPDASDSPGKRVIHLKWRGEIRPSIELLHNER